MNRYRLLLLLLQEVHIIGPDQRPCKCDGNSRNIEEFYKDEVAHRKLDEVKKIMQRNMQTLRHHLLLRKQMHGVYMRHAKRPQQGRILTDVQRLPLDINEMILERAYGKTFNS